MKSAFFTVFLAIIVMMPAAASAQVKPSSFGGRILSSEPCISPLGPSILVRILSARDSDLGFPVNYIYTPATVVVTAALPVPGGQVLGLADIPYLCWTITKGGLFGLFNVFSYSYGTRMTYVSVTPPAPPGVTSI